MDLSLKLALRQLAKSPGFAVVSILMLALGIAMSTSAFSITSAALLRPMPFPHPERLVRAFTTSTDFDSMPVPPGSAIELCGRLRDIGEFGLLTFSVDNVAEFGHPPEMRFGIAIDAKGLKIFGIEPEFGRGVLPDDDKPGKSPVVLLTDSFWREHFGSDTKVLGKTLRIGTTDHTIIGVMPPQFEEPLMFGGCSYVAVMIVWPDWRGNHTAKWMGVMGRLDAGVTRGAAQARLDGFAASLAQEFPAEVGADRMRFAPLGSSFASGRTRTIYWLVVGLAVLVLLIACANLGGVQLARSYNRRGELAVRSALGATRWHLVRVLATECGLLAVAGTGLGVLLTFWGRSLLRHWLGGPPATIDWRVLAFAISAGLIAVICFALAPAWFMSDRVLTSATKESSHTSTAGGARHWLKQLLIAGQLALALTLVSTAVAFVTGVRTFLHRDRGWQPEGLTVASLQVPYDIRKKQEKNPTLEHLENDVAALAGVKGVALATGAPLFGYQNQEKFMIEGAAAVLAGREPQAFLTYASPGFFRVLGIPLRAGRLFGPTRKGDLPVVVISVATAQHFWPGESAIGKRVRFGADQPWQEVIGIVGNASLAAGFDPPGTSWQCYGPITEYNSPGFNLVIRSSLLATTLEKPVRQAVAAIDPDIIVRVADLPTMLARMAGNGPLEVFLEVFAGSGLLIALIGLYGVMTQLTNQRRREIGIRMALGAQYRSVIGLMLGHSLRLLLTGLLFGLGGAVAVRAILQSAMPQFPTFGIGGQLLVGCVLIVAGIGACFLPSHRAARLNPVEVLRHE